MKPKLFSVTNLKELSDVNIKSEDIIIYSFGQEDSVDYDCLIKFNLSGLADWKSLNNKLLNVFDQLVQKLKVQNYLVEIKGGNFIFNNYLLVIADIFDLEIKCNKLELPSFYFSLDKEELKIFENQLKEKLSLADYNSLPPQWKSLYYYEEEIYLSKLGRTLIARGKD